MSLAKVGFQYESSALFVSAFVLHLLAVYTAEKRERNDNKAHGWRATRFSEQALNSSYRHDTAARSSTAT